MRAETRSDRQAACLAACSAAAPSARSVLQFIGDGRFRYVSTASVLNPLNDDQGEHWRLVQLNHRLTEGGLCRNGYDILSRTPPRSYGSFNLARTQYWTGEVVYLGECKK